MKEILNLADEKMNKSAQRLSQEYTTIRAGRANPAILNKVLVDYYGTPTPIQQMAAVSVIEARTIAISPWDVSTLNDIEKAIQQSDIGINPTNDGKVIRITFPQLTQERRQEIVKDVHKMREDAKVALRNIRREAMEKLKQLKKDSGYSEDQIKDGEDSLQKTTDKYSKEIDAIAADKEKEVTEI